MHILHIANDFGGSKVHSNLYRALSQFGIRQTIYCPVRDALLIGNNAFSAEGTSVIYDFIIKPYHRYVYHIKRQVIYCSLRRKVSLNDVDICHATTLFSDGGIAYKLYKKKKIPYVVTVRMTDYSSFLLRAPHTWLSAKKILLNASKIIFVSPALKEKFCNHHFIHSFLYRIKDKIVMSRNGIDDYWIDNVNTKQVPDNHSILYVGTMIRRKHPLSLIDAVLELRGHYPDIKLNLIGSHGNDEALVIEKANKNPNVIVYHGRINEKEVLLENYRNNTLFVLPSVHETFGLVYLESLSQNVPVIYTKGEGIDGLLDVHNGIGISLPSVECIKAAIEMVFKERKKYTNAGIDFESFRWSNIAYEYIKLYSKTIDR